MLRITRVLSAYQFKSMAWVFLLLFAAYVSGQLTSTEVFHYLLSDYTAEISPAAFKNQTSPQELRCILEAPILLSIAETTNAFSAIIAFQVEWTDERLAYSELASFRYLYVEAPVKIWQPNMQVFNLFELRSSVLDSLVIYPDGTVSLRRKFGIDLACTYDFTDLPFDTHKCNITLADLGSVMSPTTFSVSAEDSTANSGSTPEWSLQKVSATSQSLQALGEVYAGVQLQVVIERRQEFIQAFIIIPGVLVVALAYASFWIDYRAAPSRTTLAVITILDSLTHLYYAFSDYPKIGYRSWLLSFLYTNLVFTFSAMLEYVIVNRLHVREEQGISQRRAQQRLHKVAVYAISPSAPPPPPARMLRVQRLRAWTLRLLKSPASLLDYSFRLSFLVVYAMVVVHI